MGKRRGRNITRAADLNQPKGYSIPYGVTLSNKRCKKGRGVERWALIVKMSVLPNNNARHIEALLQGRGGQTLLIGGK